MENILAAHWIRLVVLTLAGGAAASGQNPVRVAVEVTSKDGNGHELTSCLLKRFRELPLTSVVAVDDAQVIIRVLSMEVERNDRSIAGLVAAFTIDVPLRSVLTVTDKLFAPELGEDRKAALVSALRTSSLETTQGVVSASHRRPNDLCFDIVSMVDTEALEKLRQARQRRKAQ